MCFWGKKYAAAKFSGVKNNLCAAFLNQTARRELRQHVDALAPGAVCISAQIHGDIGKLSENIFNVMALTGGKILRRVVGKHNHGFVGIFVPGGAQGFIQGLAADDQISPLVVRAAGNGGIHVHKVEFAITGVGMQRPQSIGPDVSSAQRHVHAPEKREAAQQVVKFLLGEIPLLAILLAFVLPPYIEQSLLVFRVRPACQVMIARNDMDVAGIGNSHAFSNIEQKIRGILSCSFAVVLAGGVPEITCKKQMIRLNTGIFQIVRQTISQHGSAKPGIQRIKMEV